MEKNSDHTINPCKTQLFQMVSLDFFSGLFHTECQASTQSTCACTHTHTHTESYTHFRSYKQQSTNFQHCICTRSEHNSCHCQSKKITYTPPVVCIGTKCSYIAKDTDTKSKIRATINLVNRTNEIHINKNDKHVYAPVTLHQNHRYEAIHLFKTTADAQDLWVILR